MVGFFFLLSQYLHPNFLSDFLKHLLLFVVLNFGFVERFFIAPKKNYIILSILSSLRNKDDMKLTKLKKKKNLSFLTPNLGFFYGLSPTNVTHVVTDYQTGTLNSCDIKHYEIDFSNELNNNRYTFLLPFDILFTTFQSNNFFSSINVTVTALWLGIVHLQKRERKEGKHYHTSSGGDWTSKNNKEMQKRQTGPTRGIWKGNSIEITSGTTRIWVLQGNVIKTWKDSSTFVRFPLLSFVRLLGFLFFIHSFILFRKRFNIPGALWLLVLFSGNVCVYVVLANCQFNECLAAWGREGGYLLEAVSHTHPTTHPHNQ